MERMANAGFMAGSGDDDIFADVHFFDSSSGIDPEIMSVMNQKIQKIKDKFRDWQIK